MRYNPPLYRSLAHTIFVSPKEHFFAHVKQETPSERSFDVIAPASPMTVVSAFNVKFAEIAFSEIPEVDGRDNADDTGVLPLADQNLTSNDCGQVFEGPRDISTVGGLELDPSCD